MQCRITKRRKMMSKVFIGPAKIVVSKTVARRMAKIGGFRRGELNRLSTAAAISLAERAGG